MPDHAFRTNENPERGESLFLAQQFGMNLLVTIAMTMLMAVMMFRGRAAVPLWGPGNLAFDLIPATIMPCIGATLTMTRAVNAAVIRGLIRPTRRNFVAILPKNDLIAGLVLGLVLLALLGPAFIGAQVWLYGPRPVGFSDIVSYKLIFSLIVTCANTPVIIGRARARLERGAHEQQSG